MRIVSDIALKDFEFWSGAKSNAAELTDEQFDEIEYILEDAYPEGMDETQLNDLFWFDFDWIKEMLGIDGEYDESFNRRRANRPRRTRRESLNRSAKRPAQRRMRRGRR